MNLLEISQTIRKIRIEQKMTVEQLAKASGFSKGFISQVENFRLQKCYKPAVLNMMKQRHWSWYGNTDADKEEATRILNLLKEN